MREKQIRLNFKKRFMQKIYSKDKELNEFLVRNFYIVNRNKPNRRDRFKKIFTKDYTTKHHTQHEVDRKVNLLKQLTDGEKKVAKARLKQFEEDNDVTKFSSIQLVILAGLFVMLKSDIIFQRGKEDGGIWWVLFIVILFILIGYLHVTHTFTTGRNYRKTAIYCNSLLEDVLTVEKETVTKDDK